MSGRKIEGTIVRHCGDEFGEIIVANEGLIRSLYFEDVLQSCIRLDQNLPRTAGAAVKSFRWGALLPVTLLGHARRVTGVRGNAPGQIPPLFSFFMSFSV